MSMQRVLAIATFALTGALASTDGPIGAPCFANESAMELFTNIHLGGKVSVVTGADTGIGLEVARALAARGATVIMPARNISKVQLAVADIERSVPHADLFVPKSLFDLSSFAKVRGLAEELKRFPAISILVNNAGMASNPHQLRTEDDLELVFQVDYPGHWLLTHLLLPQLRAGKGRIVNVGSKAYALACEMSGRRNCMELSRLPPPVINSTKPLPFLGIPRSNYGIAKQLMLRWTQEIARRESLARTGVTAFCLHPGFVNTSMARASGSNKIWHRIACQSDGRKGAPCPTTPAEGALTPTFLAIAPGIEGNSGSYYEWCAKTTPMVGPASQGFQDALWNLTLRWVSDFSAPVTGIVEPLLEIGRIVV